MRQSIFNEGIQARLPKIFGDGLSEYSIQASMMENTRRIHKALLSNAAHGRVMAGLKISAGSATISITSGYGINMNGDMIKCSINLNNISFEANRSLEYNVYLKYSEYFLPNPEVNYVGSPQRPVIQDQVDNETMVEIIAENSISNDTNKLYIATLVYDTTQSAWISERTGDNEDTVDYTYNCDFQSTNFAAETIGDVTGLKFQKESMCILNSGVNRVVELQIFSKYKSTTGINYPGRTDTIQNMVVFGLTQSGTPIEKKIGLIMTDNVTDGYVMRFPIGATIEDNIIALYLGSYIPACTTTTSPGSDYAPSFGPVIGRFVIQKLN